MWVERLAIKREWGCRRVAWQVLESADTVEKVGLLMGQHGYVVRL